MPVTVISNGSNTNTSSESSKSSDTDLQESPKFIKWWIMTLHVLALIINTYYLFCFIISATTSAVCSNKANSRVEVYMCHLSKSWQYEGGAFVLFYTHSIWLIFYTTVAKREEHYDYTDHWSYIPMAVYFLTYLLANAYPFICLFVVGYYIGAYL